MIAKSLIWQDYHVMKNDTIDIYCMFTYAFKNFV